MIHLQGGNFQSCFDSLLKTLKGKNFAAFKFISFRVDPFQKGCGMYESKQEVTKVVPPCK